jgi:hypothetical membrane protein
MNLKVVRLMGLFGIAAPIVGALMITLSILSTPGWSPADDTLSVLGSSGSGSVLFNNGLLMTGAVMMLFSSGLVELGNKKPIGLVGGAMYLAASVITVALGLVTINHQPYHDYLAVLLFTLIPLCMTVFSVHLWGMGQKGIASLGYVGGAVAAGALLLGSVNAYSETASILALSVWQVALGFWMRGLKEPEEF